MAWASASETTSHKSRGGSSDCGAPGGGSARPGRAQQRRRETGVSLQQKLVVQCQCQYWHLAGPPHVVAAAGKVRTRRKRLRCARRGPELGEPLVEGRLESPAGLAKDRAGRAHSQVSATTPGFHPACRRY